MIKVPFKGGYKISQLFANNPAYYSQWGFKAHEGLDLIPLDNDWNMYAVEDGAVVQDVDIPRDNYGKYCVIWNKANKRAWWYCHMEFNQVKIGQTVKQGDLIGKMGATGVVFGAHLHLGLRQSDDNGYAINTNNGYKGFIDPLPLLVELNSNGEVEALQRQVANLTKLLEDANATIKELQKKDLIEDNSLRDAVKIVNKVIES